jgi:hypothetical protein
MQTHRLGHLSFQAPAPVEVRKPFSSHSLGLENKPYFARRFAPSLSLGFLLLVFRPNARVKIMEWMVVSIRVQDAATNQPTPVRLRLVDAKGNYLPPLGRLPVIPLGWGEYLGGNVMVEGKEYSYIDGQCEVRLPAGPISVEISKGPEYTPIRETVDLKPGRMALRFTIQRHSDLPSQGWFAGDIHAHFLGPQAAWLEGSAEGLQVVNILGGQWLLGGKTHLDNILDFSGQTPALERNGCQVVVNTWNYSATLGQLLLLNSHRVVHPLILEQEGFEKYTLRDWCDQCHRKKGLAVWGGFPAKPLEAHALVFLGAIDAVEWVAWTRCPEADWYRYLDLRCKLPLVGGSGKGRNDQLLGAVRTYAHIGIGQSLTYAAWIEAIRAGRTFVTRGPLLDFQVNGQTCGAVLPLTDPAQMLQVSARSWAASVPTRLQVLHDGRILAEATVAPNATAELQLTPTIPHSGWLAARCWQVKADEDDELLAHTSPVYLQGSSIKLPPETLAEVFRQWDDEGVGRELASQPLRLAKVQATLAEARARLEKHLT